MNLYEILLSLRLEYLKNRAELNKLKQYIICDDKRITDFYFWLFLLGFHIYLKA